MTDFITILNPIHFILFIVTILFCTLYIIPIAINPRLQHHNNVFTVNLCIAATFCISYWLFYFIILEYHPMLVIFDKLCDVLDYFELMCTAQVPLAVVGLSLHRLFSIVYHQIAFFQRKECIVLCLTLQWLTGLLLALPRLTYIGSTIDTPSNVTSIHRSFFGSLELTCTTSLWIEIYTFFVTVTIPALISFLLNLIIFKYVRSSSNRVHQNQVSSVSTDLSTTLANQRLTRRDLHLVRHMIVMLSIFVGGWSPLYLYGIITLNGEPNPIVLSLFLLLAKISILFDIVNLFFYNHELTRYLQTQLWNRFQK